MLLLTERTEHLDDLCQALAPNINNLFVLHGRMSKKRRAQVLSALASLQDEAPRVLTHG